MTNSVQCPFCNTQANHLLNALDFNRRVDNKWFPYYKCPEDGLVFLHPTPDDLGQYYPPSYYELAADPESLHEIHQDTEGYKVELVNQFATGKRLLEIGPGSGGFSFLAQCAGYDVSIIEMDQKVCEFMRTKMGITAVNTADVVAGLDLLSEFDAIVLWHVIEHIPDAWRSLSALSEHLAPNGVLILAAPNPQALQFNLFGKWWTHLDAPRHVYLIPADLLEHIGRQHGLELVAKTDLDSGSLMWNRKGWQWSLRNLARHHLQNRSIGLLIEQLVRPIERRGFRGAAYTVVLRRTTG